MATTTSDQSPPPDEVRPARYGPTLVVALGWYATVIAGFVVGGLSVPEKPPSAEDCSNFFGCMSRAEFLLWIAAIVGVPVLVGLLVVTLLMVSLVARRVASPIVGGTLCAAASVGVLAAAIAAYGSLR